LKKIEISEGIFITEDDCYIDDNHYVVCKNIRLNITRENLSDFEMQTGVHRLELIKHHYLNSLTFQRDKKINDILGEDIL